jgi:hypothetical protein
MDLGSALQLDEQRGDRRSIALRHRRIGQAYGHPDIADFPQAIWLPFRGIRSTSGWCAACLIATLLSGSR